MGFWKGSAGWRGVLLALAAGFWLAGHWFFYDGWWHLRAFWWGVFPLVLLNPGRVAAAWRGNGCLWLAGAGTVWLAARRGEWFPGVEMLVFLSAVGASVSSPPGRRGDGLRPEAVATEVDRSVWWLAFFFLGGAAVCFWSLLEFYALPGRGVLELRFRDTLVYAEGLNAVLTGLLCGVSLVAGLVTVSRRWPWFHGVCLAVLAFGVLASRSRGALLAVAAGAGVWLALRGWREAGAWRKGAAVLAGGLAYGTAAFFSPPVAEGMGMLERGASGRFGIYGAYLSRMEGGEWLWGQGRLAMETVDGWVAEHPHSVFLGQLLEGGVLGLVVLLGMLGWGAWCGWRRGGALARGWLALLAFGVAAMVFDGQRVFSLGSLPRVESLLLVVPCLVLGGWGARWDDGGTACGQS